MPARCAAIRDRLRRVVNRAGNDWGEALNHRMSRFKICPFSICAKRIFVFDMKDTPTATIAQPAGSVKARRLPEDRRRG